MKKVLMLANYFYPDVASTGQLMTELCEELQDEFSITVIAAFPSYSTKIPEEYKGKFIVKEKYENIDVLRVKVAELNKKKKLSRITHILSYFLNSIFAIMKSGKQDVIFTISQPPILGGMLGVIAKRLKGAKLIYNIQDFNPEQIEAVKYSKSKVLINIARKLDKHSCNVSDKVVVVGRDMEKTLINRYDNKKVPSYLVINNWIDEESIYPLENNHPKIIEFRKKYGLENKLIVMYSGNLGLYYDLDNIIKVIGKFKEIDDVVFAFVGDGAVKNTMLNYCKVKEISNVKFIPYQNKQDLNYSLNSADIHLVTNAKGIKGVSVPSKIYGILAVGKPVIGILENDTEARILIEQSECGLCCEPGNYDEIENNIKDVIKQVQNGNKFLGKGRKFLEENLTKGKSIEKYRELFNNLV